MTNLNLAELKSETLHNYAVESISELRRKYPPARGLNLRTRKSWEVLHNLSSYNKYLAPENAEARRKEQEDELGEALQKLLSTQSFSQEYCQDPVKIPLTEEQVRQLLDLASFLGLSIHMTLTVCLNVSIYRIKEAKALVDRSQPESVSHVKSYFLTEVQYLKLKKLGIVESEIPYLFIDGISRLYSGCRVAGLGIARH